MALRLDVPYLSGRTEAANCSRKTLLYAFGEIIACGTGEIYPAISSGVLRCY